MVFEFLLFALAGAITGSAAGLLGIGGGMIVVPCLAYIFTHAGMPSSSIMHMATATSLATMMFTSSISAFSHHQRGAVRWDLFKRFLPGIIVGTVTGILIASVLNTHVLKILFGLFLLIIASRMFFKFSIKPGRTLPGNRVTRIVSFFIGAKSGLLGVGGGALSVPFLIWCNISMREASGTSAAIGVPIAWVGTVSAILTGWSVTTGVPFTLGFVYWPAALIVALFSMIFVFVGAKLSGHLPVEVIKRVFAVVLLIAAFDLLI